MRKPKEFFIIHASIDGYKAGFRFDVPKELRSTGLFFGSRDAVDLAMRYAELGERLVNMISFVVSTEEMERAG